MEVSTLSFVELITNGSMLRTRETVLVETLALLATSQIIADDKESLYPKTRNELREHVIDTAVRHTVAYKLNRCKNYILISAAPSTLVQPLDVLFFF